jgi:hypothetical protein
VDLLVEKCAKSDRIAAHHLPAAAESKGSAGLTCAFVFVSMVI